MPDFSNVFDLRAALDRVESAPRFTVRGRITRIVGMVLETVGLDLAIGDRCAVATDDGHLLAEVVGFNERGLLLMPFGDVAGVRHGAEVRSIGRQNTVAVSRGLIGRVLDGLGVPIDGRGPVMGGHDAPLDRPAPNPMERRPVQGQLATGVRAVDGLLSLGRGQRVGIFSGSGVGKSVLLGMMARHTDADVNVIALLGERGREVREFIERDLGPEGLARSVVIVATADQPALTRMRGAAVATAIAETFRDEGNNVLLMMDSATRVAMAAREVALSVGEAPATKGYPPSIFASLAKLMERAGNSATGTMTALYTVLAEGDDLEDPIADHARSVLDGHIVLSRELAEAGHFPAIDVLQSVSRVRDAVIMPEHRQSILAMLEHEAAYRHAEDLIAVGVYQQGSDPVVDRAIAVRDATKAFLRQAPDEHGSLEETVGQLAAYRDALRSLEGRDA